MGFINKLQDEKYQVELVHEFFNGKYTKEEVEDYLHTQVQSGNQKIRRGVKVLADEFNDKVPVQSKSI